MASKSAREESLNARWEVDLVCTDMGGDPLDVTNHTIFYRLGRRGVTYLSFNSIANPTRFAKITPADGEVRVTIFPTDQVTIVGGLTYDEEFWTVDAGDASVKYDQDAGTVLIRASGIS